MEIPEQQQRLREQLEVRGISDPRVLAAMAYVRREQFVPPELKHLAYDDSALPIAAGQTISQPYMVALMTQELLAPQPDRQSVTDEQMIGRPHDATTRMLEIGTGSGYQTAILATLFDEVVTIERIGELAEPARTLLAELGYTNIIFRVGDGTLGCAELAPYDGIIVTAAAPRLPMPLYNQLKPGGRLVIPIGDESLQTLTVFTKAEPYPLVRQSCNCRFVKLIGAAGWPEE